MQMELNTGNSVGAFVRVCVKVPLYRKLETKVAMRARIKEQLHTVEFDITYEKLPQFYYYCGFLGHQEKQCGRKLKGGAPDGKYDGRLRCSPPRRFLQQSGTIRAKGNQVKVSAGGEDVDHGKDSQGQLPMDSSTAATAFIGHANETIVAPRSSDNIPAMRNLSSVARAVDTDMSDDSSTLGKSYS
ncbi:hypothetical protein D1007_51324 [Hordeum vulgare]|nr:hypothetical protein D1007_51324 [Hordeum vulgare]